MKLYLVTADHVGSNHSLLTLGTSTTERPLRVLCSYYYFRKTDLTKAIADIFPDKQVDVFLDSGAYSARSRGQDISLEEYCAYVQRHQSVVTAYANLDVIMDAKATLINQTIMEDEYGLHPLPVFHVSEPWTYLDAYLEKYAYIALGGGGVSSAYYLPWLVQCFKRAQGKAVYHGFGMTGWELLKAFPWYSVDSSSWGKGFRFGHVPLFDEYDGTFKTANLGDYAGCYKYAELFRRMGFDPADFAIRSRNNRKKVCAISALAYIYAEHYLQKRWGDIQIPDRPDLTGLRLYLSDKTWEDVHHVIPYLQGE